MSWPFYVGVGLFYAPESAPSATAADDDSVRDATVSPPTIPTNLDIVMCNRGPGSADSPTLNFNMAT